MPIRLHKVLETSLNESTGQLLYFWGTEPIREWEISPQIVPVTWTVGDLLPGNQTITITYPALEDWDSGSDTYLSQGYTDFVFKIAVADHSPELFDVIGTSNPENIVPDSDGKAYFQLQFKNFNQIQNYNTQIIISHQAYGINQTGQEVLLEEQLQAIDITVNGLDSSGTGESISTDKSIYNVYYNLFNSEFYGDVIGNILNNTQNEELELVFTFPDGALTVTPNDLHSQFSIWKSSTIDAVFTAPATRTYSVEIKKENATIYSFTIYLQVVNEDGALISHNLNTDYNFCLDNHFVTVSRSQSEVDRVKMKLTIDTEDFSGQSNTVIEIYDYAMFQGSVKIYPGEEIEDFIPRMSDFSSNDISTLSTSSDLISVPRNVVKITKVDILITEYDSSGISYIEYSFPGTLWVGGKKPKAYPYLTDATLRRTFSDSFVYAAALRDDFVDNDLGRILSPNTNNQYISSSEYIVGIGFLRRLADTTYNAAQIITHNGLKLEPLPNPDNVIHVVFENQNRVPDWFSFSGDWQKIPEISHTVTEDMKYGRNFKSNMERKDTIQLNTGWLLREELDFLSQLIAADICFAFLSGTWQRLIPISKKPLAYDSGRNLHSQKVEFKLVEIDER